MIDIDLRRYGTDKEYEKFVNGLISGADIDEEPIVCELTRSIKEATDEDIQEILEGEQNGIHFRWGMRPKGI